MSALSIQVPFPVFQGRDGQPLENGYVWIGVANLNPQTNPVVAYFDAALTIPASQPLRTLNGYISRAGTPAQIYVDAVNYSILVQDCKGSMVYNFPDGTGIGAQASGVGFTGFKGQVGFVQDLADDDGSDWIGFDGAAATAVARSAQDKMRDIVSVKDFGAVGDGVANDTIAIQDALDALGSAGGSVFIPNEMRCLIGNNLTIPVNCSLVGPHKYVGSPGDNTSAPYGSMGGALIVDSAATITVSSNASVTGVLIYRSGMTFPTVNASAFAGTAITIDGDDAAVSHCQILGFNKAIYSTGDQRQRINNIWFDCVNGIEIENCLDIPYINTCHGWPFATIEASAAGTPGASIIRSGIGFYLHDTVDWAKLTDCFTYGYFRGFQLTAVNSCTLLSCSADNTTSAGVPTHVGSIGFSIGGQENRLIGCQAAAQDSAGATFATNTGVMNTVIGFNAWACGTHGILLSGGDLSVSSSNFRSMANGITISNTNARFIDGGGNRFESISGKPFNFSAASDTSKVQLSDMLSDLVNGNPITSGTYTIPSIASASVVSLPVNGDFFTVTGTTSIGTLEGGHAGRIVTLAFSGILSVLTSTGVTTAMRLSGNANYTSSANSTLTLLHTGTQWLETGRSA